MRLILVAMVLLLGGCQLGPTFSNPIEGTILAKKPGFTCTLPSGWVLDDLDPNRDDGSSWRDAKDVAKVRLAFVKKPPFSLDEIVKGTVEGLSRSTRVKDLKLEKQGALTLAGEPAQEIVYTATMNQRSRWHREVYVLKGEKLVTISFLANVGQQEAFARDFQGVLDTWKWE